MHVQGVLGLAEFATEIAVVPAGGHVQGFHVVAGGAAVLTMLAAHVARVPGRVLGDQGLQIGLQVQIRVQLGFHAVDNYFIMVHAGDGYNFLFHTWNREQFAL